MVFWHRGSKEVRRPKAFNCGTSYIILGNTWKVIITRKLVPYLCNVRINVLLPNPLGRSNGKPRLSVHRPMGEHRTPRLCLVGPLGTATMFIMPHLFLINRCKVLIVKLGAFTHITSKLLPPTTQLSPLIQNLGFGIPLDGGRPAPRKTHQHSLARAKHS